MRPLLLVVLPALTLLGPCRASAQVLPSFEDLALGVDLDDRVRVADRSGEQTSGRLTRLTRDEIVLRTHAGERRFAGQALREVAVRRYPLRRAAFIGAGVLAAVGAATVCAHDGGGACALAGAFGAAPIGAGLGLTVGALAPRMTTVYRAPDSGAAGPAPRAPGSAGPSLLEDLGLRVNLGDQLQVEDRSGVRRAGHLMRLTADEMTIRTDAGEQRFTRDDLRQVALRRRPLRQAVLIGAGAGAVMGAIAGCTGPAREECADAPILAGGLGASVGLAVGALIHRTTVVYPPAEGRTRVLPVISPHTVGVRISRRW